MMLQAVMPLIKDAHRMLRAFLLLSAAMFAAIPAAAQEVAPSPITGLLRVARSFLADLRYFEADSVARLVLQQSSLRRLQRVQALQILASANYPEEVGQQRTDSAVAVLERLTRVAPESRLPRQLSWPGLDSLAREVSRRTFGASTTVVEQQVLTGLNERALLDVSSSRPADFLLTARPHSGGIPVPLDSVSATTQATLRFRLFDGDKPLLPKGEYELIVMARDRVTADSIVIRHRVVVDITTPDLLPVPNAIDTSRLKPERTRPSRTKAIVAGALTALGTAVFASAFRDPDIKSQVAADGRAVGWGIVLGAGVAAGGWLLDKGVPLPANVEANAKAQSDFAQQREMTIAENERRRTAVRSSVMINPEPY